MAAPLSKKAAPLLVSDFVLQTLHVRVERPGHSLTFGWMEVNASRNNAGLLNRPLRTHVEASLRFAC